MGTERAETFYRIVFKQIPRNMNALGLGRDHLQSLGTFYNVAKKLSHCELTIFGFPFQLCRFGYAFSRDLAMMIFFCRKSVVTF